MYSNLRGLKNTASNMQICLQPGLQRWELQADSRQFTLQKSGRVPEVVRRKEKEKNPQCHQKVPEAKEKCSWLSPHTEFPHSLGYSVGGGEGATDKWPCCHGPTIHQLNQECYCSYLQKLSQTHIFICLLIYFVGPERELRLHTCEVSALQLSHTFSLYITDSLSLPHIP